MVGRGDFDGPAVALDGFGIPLGHEVLVAPSVAMGYKAGARMEIETAEMVGTYVSDAHMRPWTFSPGNPRTERAVPGIRRSQCA